MQDIADTVGITATALYRHFPNKYALFAHTVFSLTDQLVEATEAPAQLPAASAEEARVALGALVDGAIAVTLTNRTTAGTYRWEGRYLERADRKRLNELFALVGERFLVPLRVYRPDVEESERWVIMVGALSAIASPSLHTTVLARPRLSELLRDAAWTLFDIDVNTYLSNTAPTVPSPAEMEGPESGSRRREQLIDAGVRLFARNGYNEVTIEELAAEVDLTPSGIYRHFDGKSALLLGAYNRASDWLEHSNDMAAAQASSPLEELRLLCGYYINFSFQNADLMRVYFAEQGNLAADDQRRFQGLQKLHMARWIGLLQQVHPDLNARESAVVLYTLFGIIGDQLSLIASPDGAAIARLLAYADALLGLSTTTESS